MGEWAVGGNSPTGLVRVVKGEAVVALHAAPGGSPKAVGGVADLFPTDLERNSPSI